MPTTSIPIRNVLIRYICDECGDGQMIPTGRKGDISPLMYQHVCQGCGHKQNFTCQYPHQSFEEIKE